VTKTVVIRTAGIAVLVGLLTVATTRAAETRVSLTDEPGPEGGAGSWKIDIDVRDLEGSGPIEFICTDGSWPRDIPFLELLECDPPLASRADDDSSLTLTRPAAWDGRARLSYRLLVVDRGSETHVSHTRMPTRGDQFAFGFSSNTILRPTQDGAPAGGSVSVSVIPSSRAETVVTGWGGETRGRQEVRPDPAWGNSQIAFGRPTGRSDATEGGVTIEVFQFGPGRDLTARVADLMRAFPPTIARYTGRPARAPSRTFLTDSLRDGMATDFGLHISVRSDPNEYDPWFATVAAHETFHEWLGFALVPDRQSLTWFHEGFTEYFALWLTTSTGIANPPYFAETLARYDRFARSDTAFGEVPFTDPDVVWRDGDGRCELMAYRGAPVLALALDVELRARGEPGLLQLIRDLCARAPGPYTTDELRAWFVAQGMADTWDASIAGLAVPSAAESLERAGYECVDGAWSATEATKEFFSFTPR